MSRVLIIDDDRQICRVLTQLTENLGLAATAVQDPEQGLALALGNSFDLVLLDLEFPTGNGLDILPRLAQSPGAPEVIIITGTGRQKSAEIAFKHGAWDYIPKPFVVHEVSLPINRALRYRAEKNRTRQPSVLNRGGIVGDSPAILASLREVAAASASQASVLIQGETGTGKELFARAIHENSDRAGANFVPVDCASLPESLVESTLFGHVRGAYTGADRQREGLVKHADGGTLFLDEVGELPLSLQKSLLRVLQEHRFRPVGGLEELHSDFRLIAATNRNLDQEAAKGAFRNDLLFRLRALTLTLPPLRERKEDLRPIVLNYLEKLASMQKEMVKAVSPEFFEIMEAYHWPGNVRELLNVLQGALASSGEETTLYPIHLPPGIRMLSLNVEQRPVPAPPKEQSPSGEFPRFENCLDQAAAAYLKTLLAKCNGNRHEACRLSGLSKTRLYNLLKKYNLPSVKAHSQAGN